MAGNNFVFEDFENRCRLCFSTSSLVNIFDHRLESTENIAEVVEVTTGVKISPDDEVSHMLCNKCSHLTIRMFKFRTTSILNDLELREKAARRRTMHLSVKELFKQYPKLVVPPAIIKQNVSPVVVLEEKLTDYLTETCKNRDRSNEDIHSFMSTLKLSSSTAGANIRNEYDETSFLAEKRSISPTCETSQSKKPKHVPPKESKNEDDNEQSLFTVKSVTKEIFTCDLCYHVSDTKKELKKHKNKHMRCNLCRTRFISMDETKEHEKTCVIKEVMSKLLKVYVKRCEEIKEIREKYPNAFRNLSVIEISDDEDDPVSASPKTDGGTKKPIERSENISNIDQFEVVHYLPESEKTTKPTNNPVQCAGLTNSNKSRTVGNLGVFSIKLPEESSYSNSDRFRMTSSSKNCRSNADKQKIIENPGSKESKETLILKTPEEIIRVYSKKSIANVSRRKSFYEISKDSSGKSGDSSETSKTLGARRKSMHEMSQRPSIADKSDGPSRGIIIVDESKGTAEKSKEATTLDKPEGLDISAEYARKSITNASRRKSTSDKFEELDLFGIASRKSLTNVSRRKSVSGKSKSVLNLDEPKKIEIPKAPHTISETNVSKGLYIFEKSRRINKPRDFYEIPTTNESKINSIHEMPKEVEKAKETSRGIIITEKSKEISKSGNSSETSTTNESARKSILEMSEGPSIADKSKEGIENLEAASGTSKIKESKGAITSEKSKEVTTSDKTGRLDILRQYVRKSITNASRRKSTSDKLEEPDSFGIASRKSITNVSRRKSISGKSKDSDESKEIEISRALPPSSEMNKSKGTSITDHSKETSRCVIIAYGSTHKMSQGPTADRSKETARKIIWIPGESSETSSTNYSKGTAIPRKSKESTTPDKSKATSELVMISHDSEGINKSTTIKSEKTTLNELSKEPSIPDKSNETARKVIWIPGETSESSSTNYSKGTAIPGKSKESTTPDKSKETSELVMISHDSEGINKSTTNKSEKTTLSELSKGLSIPDKSKETARKIIVISGESSETSSANYSKGTAIPGRSKESTTPDKSKEISELVMISHDSERINKSTTNKSEKTTLSELSKGPSILDKSKETAKQEITPDKSKETSTTNKSDGTPVPEMSKKLVIADMSASMITTNKSEGVGELGDSTETATANESGRTPISELFKRLITNQFEKTAIPEKSKGLTIADKSKDTSLIILNKYGASSKTPTTIRPEKSEAKPEKSKETSISGKLRGMITSDKSNVYKETSIPGLTIGDKSMETSTAAIIDEVIIQESNPDKSKRIDGPEKLNTSIFEGMPILEKSLGLTSPDGFKRIESNTRIVEGMPILQKSERSTSSRIENSGTSGEIEESGAINNESKKTSTLEEMLKSPGKGNPERHILDILEKSRRLLTVNSGKNTKTYQANETDKIGSKKLKRRRSKDENPMDPKKPRTTVEKNNDIFNPKISLVDKDALEVNADDDDAYLKNLLGRIRSNKNNTQKQVQTELPSNSDFSIAQKEGFLFEFKNLRDHLKVSNIPVNMNQSKKITIKYNFEPSHLKKSQSKTSSDDVSKKKKSAVESSSYTIDLTGKTTESKLTNNTETSLSNVGDAPKSSNIDQRAGSISNPSVSNGKTDNSRNIVGDASRTSGNNTYLDQNAAVTVPNNANPPANNPYSTNIILPQILNFSNNPTLLNYSTNNIPAQNSFNYQTQPNFYIVNNSNGMVSSPVIVTSTPQSNNDSAVPDVSSKAPFPRITNVFSVVRAPPPPPIQKKPEIDPLALTQPATKPQDATRNDSSNQIFTFPQLPPLKRISRPKRIHVVPRRAIAPAPTKDANNCDKIELNNSGGPGQNEHSNRTETSKYLRVKNLSELK